MILLLIGLAVLVLALVWTATLVVGLNLVWAAGATALVALALVLTLLLRRKKKGPSKPGADPVAPPSHDPRALASMRSAVDRSLQVLRGSKLGGSALSLPWYLVVGPVGAGKTELLRHCGLSFPLPPAGASSRNPAPTAHSELWMCNEAVLVDTSGRYFSDEVAHPEWLAFLEHIRRSRSGVPVDGVLLALGAADLSGATEEGIAALGKSLRRRLDEVDRSADALVPVYLVVTKADRLPGFAESFADFRKAERSQVWGFTFDDAEGPLPRAALENRFDEWVEAAQARALVRLGQERALPARERIYQLPQQLEVLRGPLGGLAEQLLAPSAFQDVPGVRGVFFTSACQDGVLADAVMAPVAQKLGLSAAPRATAPPTHSKSFFIHDLIARVAVGDVGLRRPSARQLRRHQRAIYALSAATFAVALLLTLPPLIAYLRNRDLLQGLLQASEAAASTSDSVELAMERMAPVREQLELLRRYAAEGPPMGMRFGMYQGEEVLPTLSAVFATAVRDRLLAPLLREDLARLAGFSSRFRGIVPPVDASYTEAHGALKLHLLLSAPRASGEPGLREAEQRWALGRLMALWKRATSANVTATARDAVERNLRLYLRLVASEPAFGLVRQKDLVDRGRATLSRAPYEELALERLVAAADGPTYDLDLASLLGPASGGLRWERSVRGAFTRRGWEEVIRGRLDASDEQEDGWVLGDNRGAQDRTRLQRSYFRRYITEWREFLAGVRIDLAAVRVDGTRSNAEVLGLLQSLTRGEPTPLSRLFRTVATNVRLVSEAEKGKGAEEALKKSLLDKAKSALGSAPEVAVALAAVRGSDALGSADVERTFAGFVGFGAPAAVSDPNARPLSTGLDLYLEQLVAVRDALQREADDPGDRAALTQLTLARTKVRSLIDGQEVGWRQTLNALLWPLLEAIAQTSSSAVAAEASALWCSSVLAPFEQALARSYPFAADGPDAPMADFVEFFRPETGILWGFVSSALKNDVERAGDRYRFARKPGNTSPAFRPALIEFLNRARDVTSAMFPPSAREPSIPLSVSIQPAQNVAGSVLEVDGQAIEYRNGPKEWHQLKWPNPAQAGRSVLRVRPARGGEQELQKVGEWSFFRLLDAATVRQVSDRLFVASWHFGGAAADLEIELRPGRTESPFFGWRGEQKQLFHLFREKGLNLPREIGLGPESCPPSR